jgi:hypothetical protein
MLNPSILPAACHSLPTASHRQPLATSCTFCSDVLIPRAVKPINEGDGDDDVDGDDGDDDETDVESETEEMEEARRADPLAFKALMKAASAKVLLRRRKARELKVTDLWCNKMDMDAKHAYGNAWLLLNAPIERQACVDVSNLSICMLTMPSVRANLNYRIAGAPNDPEGPHQLAQSNAEGATACARTGPGARNGRHR